MLTSLVNRVKSSKALLGYFFLTYLDKVISFALPLSILFIIKNNNLYTFVEVVFSYATLVMVVVELGFSNYLFFGYKNASDKEKFTSQAQLCFKFLLLFYCICCIPLFIGVDYFDSKFLMFFVLICVRTLFTLYINFYSNIFRLNDNPSGIYATTIVVNVLSFILLMLANYFTWPHKIVYFLLPSLLLIVGVCLRFIFLEIRHFKFNEFAPFLKESLRFSWPIILNVLAMSYMNNYAKIYAYGHLSQDETMQVSYIMRIGLIIQLTHASFSSFFSKALFMDEAKRLNSNIFKKYSFFIIVSTALVAFLIITTNYLFKERIQIPLSFSTFLFIFYIILWCYTGYLEIYFGIMDANRRILYYSILSVVIYTVLLNLFGTIDLLKLAICMVISAFVNLALVVMGLSKLRVIGLKN